MATSRQPFARIGAYSLVIALLLGCSDAAPPRTTTPPPDKLPKSQAPESPEVDATPLAPSISETPAAEIPAAEAPVAEATVAPEPPPEFEYYDPLKLPRLPAPEHTTAMPEPDRVWIDAESHEVIVDGYVSLREGMLEMFACTMGSKEHESIVAVFSSAQVVHAALLAVGAEVGHPVRFRPEFVPPAGTEIDIEVRWLDEAGAWQSCRAQDMIVDARTGKAMDAPWVFAGSGFYKDPETGREYYMAEVGDFICVSNFSTAMLDIPVESSEANEGLLFEANPEKVPRLGTPVRLVLKPKL